MFGGLHKRGSLRKVLCKRNKPEAISTPSSAQEPTSPHPAPPLTPNILEPDATALVTDGNSGELLLLGGNQHAVPSSEGDALPLGSPRSPLVDNSPLMVDVNCVCNSAIAQRQQKKVGYHRRIFGPQFSGPAEMCRVPGHEQHHHNRSISASPQCLSTPVSAQLSDTQLNVPLLIPLSAGLGSGGPTYRIGIGRGSSLRGVAQHRMSLSGGGPPSRPSSTNVYLATLDHPTNNFHETASIGSSGSVLMASQPEISKIIFESQEAVYQLFMKAHKCYDLIPTSSKLVIFDTELPVSKAFFALVYNGVRAAPLFDNKLQEFVGMLTITDFIQILHKYYTKERMGEGMRELEEHKISTWREVFQTDRQLKPLVTIDPSESLFKAVQILVDSKIHRLPVIENATGNILYILTHKRLIKFLFLYINDLPRPSYMDKTPKELGIGTWGNICAISKDTPLITAMKIFLSKRVSALPLLDSDGRVVDIYAKFDAIQLAADKSYTNLDATVYEALQHRSDWFEGVRKCSENDSLFTVIEAIVKAEVHRLIVTDQQQRVVGVISLSDILNYLVLMPPSPDPTESQTAVPLIIATETTHSASVPFIHAAVAPHASFSFSSFSASDTNTKKQPARE